MSFTFDPSDGFRNKATFPTTPASEDAFRDSMQDLLDQIRDYINTALLVLTDGTLAIINVDQKLLLKSFYDAGVLQYGSIDSINASGDPVELRLNPSGGPVVFSFVDQRLIVQAVYEAGVTQYGLIKAVNTSGETTDLKINPDGGLVTINNEKAWHAGISGPFYNGAGSPEGSVAAAVGSIYQRSDGGASTTLYVKESGSGNTGWKAVQTA